MKTLLLIAFLGLALAAQAQDKPKNWWQQRKEQRSKQLDDFYKAQEQQDKLRDNITAGTYLQKGGSNLIVGITIPLVGIAASALINQSGNNKSTANLVTIGSAGIGAVVFVVGASQIHKAGEIMNRAEAH